MKTSKQAELDVLWQIKDWVDQRIKKLETVVCPICREKKNIRVMFVEKSTKRQGCWSCLTKK